MRRPVAWAAGVGGSRSSHWEIAFYAKLLGHQAVRLKHLLKADRDRWLDLRLSAVAFDLQSGSSSDMWALVRQLTGKKRKPGTERCRC